MIDLLILTPNKIYKKKGNWTGPELFNTDPDIIPLRRDSVHFKTKNESAYQCTAPPKLRYLVFYLLLGLEKAWGGQT